MLFTFTNLHRTRIFDKSWTAVQKWTSLNVAWVTGYLQRKFVVEIKEEGIVVFVLSQVRPNRPHVPQPICLEYPSLTDYDSLIRGISAVSRGSILSCSTSSYAEKATNLGNTSAEHGPVLRISSGLTGPSAVRWSWSLESTRSFPS